MAGVSRLVLVFKLDKSNIATSRNESDLFEPREPVQMRKDGKNVGVQFERTDWLNNMVSIISLVSEGRFVKNRILLGASLPVGCPLDAKFKTQFRVSPPSGLKGYGPNSP